MTRLLDAGEPASRWWASGRRARRSGAQCSNSVERAVHGAKIGGPLRFLASTIQKTLLVTLAVGCASTPPKAAESGSSTAATPDATSAVVEMFPVSRSKTRGMIRLRATEQGVLIRGKLTGLGAGKYGLGVHETGDCGLNGKSAGPYFTGGNKIAPLGHLEDLLIEKDKVDGVNVDRTEAHVKLSGPYSIIGKSLVIEAWPTDPKVDPATVPFLSCGVIRAE